MILVGRKPAATFPATDAIASPGWMRTQRAAGWSGAANRGQKPDGSATGRCSRTTSSPSARKLGNRVRFSETEPKERLKRRRGRRQRRARLLRTNWKNFSLRSWVKKCDRRSRKMLCARKLATNIPPTRPKTVAFACPARGHRIDKGNPRCGLRLTPAEPSPIWLSSEKGSFTSSNPRLFQATRSKAFLALFPLLQKRLAWTERFY